MAKAKTTIIEGVLYYKYPCSFCGKDILVKRGEKENTTYCPHCRNTSRWILKPETERLLFELQEEYLSKIDQNLFSLYAEEIKKPKSEQNEKIIQSHETNMDRKLLGKMYQLVYDYSGSLLKKYIKSKAFFLPHEEFIDTVYEITFRWYSQFTKKPGFKIKDSWAGQLRWKITEVLYDETRVVEGQSLSLDYESDDFKDSFLERNDLQSIVHNPYESTIAITEELRKVLLLIINTINTLSKFEAIVSLIAFLYFLKKDKRKEYEIYNLYGNRIKGNTEKIKVELRRYLRSITEDYIREEEDKKSE